jgi:plastocyanin
MVRTSLVAGIVVALALALGAPAFARADAMKLKGTVGPGFTISLTQNGHKVKTLKAGTYTLVVADKASIHNFVLEKSGGKFEKAVTSVGFVGTKTIRVKLTRGKWEFYCKPHESTMHGDFTVK